LEIPGKVNQLDEPETSFHPLHTALESSIRLENEEVAAKERDSIHSRLYPSSEHRRADALSNLSPTSATSATFLQGESMADIWSAFLLCWTTIYIGFPDVLRLDAGSVFTSKEFKALATGHGIEFHYSGIEAYNSIASGETMHACLRRVFIKVCSEFQNMDPMLALFLSVKALNDTANANGLVPSMLVFGVIPRLPASVLSSELPEQDQSFSALRSARAEMEQIMCERRIKQALATRPSNLATIRPGMLVLVYRENFGKLTGPFDVVKVDNKIAWVAGADSAVVQYNSSQVKPYVEPDDFSDETILSAVSCGCRKFIDSTSPNNERGANPNEERGDHMMSDDVSILASNSHNF
jgi:hypothetical protein